MALNFQSVDMPLFQGVESQTEEKQIPANKTIQLDNVVIRQTGEVEKRAGYKQLSVTTASNIDTSITPNNNDLFTANSIHADKDSIILVGDNTITGTPPLGSSAYDGPGIWKRDDDADTWNRIGDFTPVTFETQPIGAVTLPIGNGPVSCTYGKDYKCVNLITISTAGFSILNNNNEVILDTVANGTALHTSDSCKSVSITDAYGTSFMSFSNTTDASGIIELKYIPEASIFDAIGNGNVINAANDLSATVFTFDICAVNYPARTDGTGGLFGEGVAYDAYQEAVLVYRYADITNDIVIRTFDSHGNQHKSFITTVAGGNAIKGAVTVWPMNNSDGITEVVYIFWQDINGRIDGVAYNPNFNVTPYKSVTQLSTSAIFTGVTVKNITAAASSSEWAAGTSVTNRGIRLFIEVPGISEEQSSVCSFLVDQDFAGSISTIARKFRIGLAGKAFTYRDRAYVLTCTQFRTQSTFFLANVYNLSNWQFPAKVFYRDAVGMNDSIHLSEISQTGTDTFTLAVNKVERLLSPIEHPTQGTNKKEFRINLITFNMNPDPLPSVILGEATLLGGGIITEIDGRAQPANYLIYPESITLAAPSGTGPILDGYHSYQAIYKRVNRRGELVLSGTSEIIGQNYSDSGFGSGNIGVPANAITTGGVHKPNTDWLELYKTIKNDDLMFFGKSTQTGATTNFHTLSFTDGDETELAIQDNIQLYTNDNSFPNVAPPGSKIMAVSPERAFLVPMDDPYKVWFSKRKISRIAVEWAEPLQITLESDGPNTGLGVLSDKLIIFKRDKIYYAALEGLTDQGQSQAIPIQTDDGCVDPKSVVSFGDGVIFKSGRGFCLLTTGAQIVYIGTAVFKYNSFSIQSADLLGDRSEIRFLLAQGQGVLCYNYYTQAWTHFTNHSYKAALALNNQYICMKSNGVVRVETPNAYSEIGSNIPMRIRTAWFDLAGLQGYQRVKTATIIGTYRSQHTLNVNVYTNYDDTTIKQTISFTSTTSQVGDETLQYVMHLNNMIQKCESIQFEIWDSGQGGTLESCKLSNITLQVGGKQGIFKTPKRRIK